MKLQTVEIINIGPFSSPVLLEIDPEVTILTGPNDVGKTSALYLIAAAFEAAGYVCNLEELFNQDVHGESKQSWQERGDFGGRFVFENTEYIPAALNSEMRSWKNLTVVAKLAPGINSLRVTKLEGNNQTNNVDIGFAGVVRLFGFRLTKQSATRFRLTPRSMSS